MGARGRRLVRLWIILSIFWLAYWIWLYNAKCFRAGNGMLGCPSGGDPGSTTMVPTGDWRLIALAALPPLWTGVIGLLGFWALQGFSREKNNPSPDVRKPGDTK